MPRYPACGGSTVEALPWGVVSAPAGVKKGLRKARCVGRTWLVDTPTMALETATATSRASKDHGIQRLTCSFQAWSGRPTPGARRQASVGMALQRKQRSLVVCSMSWHGPSAAFRSGKSPEEHRRGCILWHAPKGLAAADWCQTSPADREASGSRRCWLAARGPGSIGMLAEPLLNRKAFPISVTSTSRSVQPGTCVLNASGTEAIASGRFSPSASLPVVDGQQVGAPAAAACRQLQKPPRRTSHRPQPWARREHRRRLGRADVVASRDHGRAVTGRPSHSLRSDLRGLRLSG